MLLCFFTFLTHFTVLTMGTSIATWVWAVPLHAYIQCHSMQECSAQSDPGVFGSKKKSSADVEETLGSSKKYTFVSGLCKCILLDLQCIFGTELIHTSDCMCITTDKQVTSWNLELLYTCHSLTIYRKRLKNIYDMVCDTLLIPSFQN